MDWTLAVGNLNLGIFDFIVLAAILIGAVSGGAMGFSNSACKMLGYVVSFPLALLFVRPVSGFVASKINVNEVLCALIAYVLLVGIIYLLFRVLGNVLYGFFDTIGLSALDRFAGAIWGILLALIVVFLILGVLSLQEFISLVPLKNNSVIYTEIYCKLFPTAERALKGALLGTR